ncbi:cytochrome b/b6 domain-containing protein [Rhodovulum adriaticum]|uniref:Cytochrome b n=1 Tax=Rhodovulum adriaticum TaxID=35804 RepID=A0A4R2NV53_RHOAD|nr:cytochrome b/b6 domain-containing protein [Rhodovulum adriaticum]MBK1635965.1 cytochrome B [Rhodovulum adriaticum]TCP25424.1 cytochrome b [Rhodovulum adriaticum]
MTKSSSTDTANLETVRVWDPLLRVFHWALTICVVAAWGLGQFGPDVMTLHFYFGYAVLGLLAFRVLWGFVGPKHARFRSFAYGPFSILKYVFGMFRRRPSYWRGHNPLGGFFVFVLLAVLLGQAATGLFVDPEDYVNVGPLAKYVSSDTARTALSWHDLLAWAVLGLVALHVAAIGFYNKWKGENLVTPMITGRKTVRKDG